MKYPLKYAAIVDIGVAHRVRQVRLKRQIFLSQSYLLLQEVPHVETSRFIHLTFLKIKHESVSTSHMGKDKNGLNTDI